MSNRLITSTLALGALLSSAPALAAKPVDSSGLPFGNGFPSGEHFNLNIIGKKDAFACPAPELDTAGNPLYGNVIFFPRVQGSDPISILIESGSKGPREAPDTTALQVTDWCTESFPDFDPTTGGPAALGDPAAFRLPANANGYAVYARITGKPGEDGEPTVTFNQGELVYVQDEALNDLILLGTLKGGSLTVYRTNEITTSSGKGVRKATDITDMFEYTGLVCSTALDATGDSTSLCCNIDPLTGNPVNCSLAPEDLVCPVGTELVTAMCNEYVDQWVFNIADFVGYLWDLDTSGAYVVQVRFYPIQ